MHSLTKPYNVAAPPVGGHIFYKKSNSHEQVGNEWHEPKSFIKVFGCKYLVFFKIREDCGWFTTRFVA